MAKQSVDSPSPYNMKISFFWGGLETGDASWAPYHQSIFGSYHRAMLNAMWNIGDFCILPTRHSSYNGLLAPTNPAGTTLRMASGAAYIDGFLYTNDGNIDFNLATTGYYRLVIRSSRDLKTVRSKVLGPSSVGYPSIESDPYHLVDAPIAMVYSNGATLTIIDERTFFRNITATKHTGGTTRWFEPGTPGVPRVIDRIAIQLGSFEPDVSGSGSIELPESYDHTLAWGYGHPPIVFLSARSTRAPAVGTSCPTLTVSEVDAAGRHFDYSCPVPGFLDSIMFLAIGGQFPRTSIEP